MIEIKHGILILKYLKKFIMSYYLAFVSLEVLSMNIQN